LSFLFSLVRRLVENLTVFLENMKKNIDKTHGVIFSQRVLLALIDAGMVREKAYDMVQPKAMKAWEEGIHFRTLIEADETITNLLSQEQIADCFDYTYHLKNVDAIFERMGLN